MNIRKSTGALVGALAAVAAFAGEEWSGTDWMLRGEDGVVYRHELSSGQTIEARNVYISTNDCGAALVANGATITATGTACLGYQNKTNLASNASLTLTNTTMTVTGALSVNSVGSGSATLALGPDSLLSASYFQSYAAISPKIYFNGGRLKVTGSSQVFNPSGHGWSKKADGSWTDNWPNPYVYVYANEGPIDITVDKDVKMASGNSGRGLDLSGTKGFVKRGKGVLDWVWYPTANNGSINGNVTYTGDTVVKEGGIRVGDTWTYKSGVDTRPLRNPMPAQSPLILEANTFLDVSSNASTWCSISGAGIVTNRTTLMRGKVILGGTVADCELSPASVGGAVDVYKRGNGTLTVNTSRIDGEIVVSNGTLKIASGSTLKVKKIVLLPNTKLDAQGATLTDVVIDLNGRTVGFATVSDVQATVKYFAGGTLTFGADGSAATLSQVAEAGVKLIKQGNGTLTLVTGNGAGDLTLEGGTALYDAAPTLRGYRHYRFKVDAPYKSTARGMQFSEFRLLANGVDVTGLRSGIQYAPYKTTHDYPPDYDVYTSYGSEIVTKVVDGSLSSKWLDYRARSNRIATEGDELYIQIDYADEMVVSAYSWATANDEGPYNEGRDPAAWRLLASDDGETWETLDERTNMGPYETRTAWVGDFAVTYPESRYERTRALGLVTVETGATLDLRGGAFVCQGLANHGGTILRDDGTAISLTARRTRWVNPFIGTLREGSSHPGATWPMGMVQPGPEVGTAVPPPSGYRYQETVLQGFTQNRIMGTFWGCLHDVLLLPFAGDEPAFAKMDKKSERAEPGYYAVRLPEKGILCELTCSERVAYHRYTFEKGGTGRVLVDLGAGPLSTWGGELAKPPRVIASESTVGTDGILSGHNVVKCNWPDRDVFYALMFSRPWTRVSELGPRPDGSPAKRYVFDFDLKAGESVVVKAALSSVDVAGACANLAADPKDFDFAARRRAAHDAWAKLLDVVELEGDPDRLTVFYTMLYQAYVQPQRIDDVDGRVRIDKNKVITVAKPFFTGFLDTWDTFRAAHPLYTVLTPERAGLFAESLLAYPRNGVGGIPSNTVFGRKRHVMPGSHGVPIVADAFLKGLLPGFTADEVFAYLDKSVRTERLVKKGWHPLDPKDGCGHHLVHQLDEVTDAGAICEFSRRTGAGRERVARVHRPSADSWTNVFDVATGAMRPRNSQGAFVGPEPFDFFRQCLSREERAARTPWGYNEGGYAQWAWHVLGDPERRVALSGGPEKAAVALDRIFKAPTDIPGQRRGYGCTGPVGQYFHGNEPTHHMPYYYQYAGRPDRTQEIVREICTNLYRNEPDGMCGDGDSGQMGAWYVFSALGFYPFNPVGGDYVLGAPQYPRATLRLANGRSLTVVAKNLSERNLHVRSVTLNGRPLEGFVLKHEQILSGGELVFEMCP